jgi:glyoxylase I family protein
VRKTAERESRFSATHAFRSDARAEPGRIREVTVSHLFAGLPVADYAEAYDWYVLLLGRPADMLPHDSEAVWRLAPGGSVYVVEDAERAGSGLVAVALEDLEAHEERLRAVDVAFTEQSDGLAPRRLVVKDPDGNTLTFFQDPAQSGA